MIIAFYSYHCEAGKDTAAGLLREKLEDLGYSVKLDAFARRMKIVCADALGHQGPDDAKVDYIDRLKLDGYVRSYMRQHLSDMRHQPEPSALTHHDGRDFIIGLAESIRRLDPGFWTRQVVQDYDADALLITDLRFQPEFDAVKVANGRVVEIIGRGYHKNEDDLRLRCDRVINNAGNRTYLAEQIDGLVEDWQL